ncbi:MAG: 3-deoxy-D-manno-octulosonic acid transferase [Candidatus Omnitrophica bacterium]|nr:3-deoxy-D-manno-octulosonic acid transferase [Candidatus Omnitrophota bacterium]
MKAILILYDLILILLLPFYLISLLLEDKFSRQIFKRFAIGEKSVWQEICGKDVIWIHAVSLGEVSTCKNLINKLSLKFPERIILITTITQTGRALAKSLSKGNVFSLYIPFDFSFLIKPFIKKINPRLLVLLETELWPNLLYYAQKENIPVLVLNTRLSDRSFGKYRLFSWFVKQLTKKVRMFCAQSDLDGERLLKIGIDKQRIRVTGNMKFDAIEELDNLQLEELNGLRAKISLKSGDFLIVAGSTHDKEEDSILDIFIGLKRRCSNLRLLIAPRHLERVGSIEKLIIKKGLRPYKFSGIDSPSADEIIILDTIGKLRFVYSLANLVFMGGSLVPVGGHNILEPAFFGKPIVVGPYMHNFREITQIFLSNNALIQTKGIDELKLKMEELICDKDKLTKLGNAAKAVLSSKQGATLVNIGIIENSLV